MDILRKKRGNRPVAGGSAGSIAVLAGKSKPTAFLELSTNSPAPGGTGLLSGDEAPQEGGGLQAEEMPQLQGAERGIPLDGAALA